MQYILLGIILAIPAAFFFLCIANIVKIVHAKKANAPVPKTWIAQAIIFGVVFISITIYYLWVMYALSQAIAHM